MIPCRRRAIYASRQNQAPIKITEESVHYPLEKHSISSIEYGITATWPEVQPESMKRNTKECPKCGKVCERGLFMHMKYCKG